jgi:hypothetical protein
VSVTVPVSVRRVAARALRWRRQFGRGGLSAMQAHQAGIGSGVVRAQTLARGRVTVDTVRRMAAYFARHAVDKKAPGFYDEANPSAGRIAWDLWGGDEGRDFADGVLDTLPVDLGGRA